MLVYIEFDQELYKPSGKCCTIYNLFLFIFVQVLLAYLNYSRCPDEIKDLL